MTAEQVTETVTEVEEAITILETVTIPNIHIREQYMAYIERHRIL